MANESYRNRINLCWLTVCFLSLFSCVDVSNAVVYLPKKGNKLLLC